MLNAGIMATPPSLSSDGYESQFATNYLGHALLAKLLLPLLIKTAAQPDADVRIISTSSHLHVDAPKQGIVLSSLKTGCEDMSAYMRYGQSKLAQILWTRRAAALYPRIRVVAVHPGVVRMELLATAMGVAHFMFVGVEEGVRNLIWAAVAGGVESGEYYDPVGVVGSGTKRMRDEELARVLWEWTERELEGYGV